MTTHRITNSDPEVLRSLYVAGVLTNRRLEQRRRFHRTTGADLRSRRHPYGRRWDDPRAPRLSLPRQMLRTAIVILALALVWRAGIALFRIALDWMGLLPTYHF